MPGVFRTATAQRTWTVDVERIERARILNGWTRRQLGAAANVDPKTLNDMCNGRRRPHLGTVQAVCRALGLQLADVVMFIQTEAGGRPLH
jgi:transcriptional regulator with XRE-family HTH domain